MRKRPGRARIPPKGNPPTYLLDRFSTTDVANWRQQAEAEIEYAVTIFFHLEAQRGLQAAAIREALSGVEPIAQRLSGWGRIMDYRYSLEPLSPAGSMRKSGRFNIGADIDTSRFPPFPALYLAEDYETAYAEKFGKPAEPDENGLIGEQFALRRPSSFASVRLNGQLNQLFDLTETGNLRRFAKMISQFKMTGELLALARAAKLRKPYLVETAEQLKKQLLANDWRKWSTQFGVPGNSQVFGRLVRDVGFEGILYPSVRGPRRCIALFPDKLAHGESFLELADQAPLNVSRKRLDANSWSNLDPGT